VTLRWVPAATAHTFSIVSLGYVKKPSGKGQFIRGHIVHGTYTVRDKEKRTRTLCHVTLHSFLLLLPSLLSFPQYRETRILLQLCGLLSANMAVLFIIFTQGVDAIEYQIYTEEKSKRLPFCDHSPLFIE
jgi:hypothetical protein